MTIIEIKFKRFGIAFTIRLYAIRSTLTLRVWLQEELVKKCKESVPKNLKYLEEVAVANGKKGFFLNAKVIHLQRSVSLPLQIFLQGDLTLQVYLQGNLTLQVCLQGDLT